MGTGRPNQGKPVVGCTHTGWGQVLAAISAFFPSPEPVFYAGPCSSDSLFPQQLLSVLKSPRVDCDTMLQLWALFPPGAVQMLCLAPESHSILWGPNMLLLSPIHSWSHRDSAPFASALLLSQLCLYTAQYHVASQPVSPGSFLIPLVSPGWVGSRSTSRSLLCSAASLLSC